MKALRFAALSLARDLRSGELSVLMLALVVAVGALTAVGFFTSRIARGMTEQAAEVLAADLKLESGRPLAALSPYVDRARAEGLASAQTLSLSSVVYAGEEGQLASLHGVGEGYPLRGRVRIADEPFGTARSATGLPPAGELWADARLLGTLRLKVGDPVKIGRRQFRIGAVLDYRPDQGSGFSDLAPSILLRLSDLEATGLAGPGSRASWALLLAGAPDDLARFERWLKANKGAGERLVDVAEASAQIGTAMNRAQHFLSLAALATIMLGAIAVAITARRYAAQNLDAVALQKCLGATQAFVFGVSLLELLLAAILASAIGTALGYGAELILARLMKELVAAHLPPPTFDPAWLGLATAIVMVLGFALPPLLELRKTPPARVLSRNASAPPLHFAASYALALAALGVILYWLVGDPKLVVYVGGAVVGAGIVLYGGGLVLVRLAGLLRGGGGVAWRHGLASLARRGRESAVQVVAFGLGLTVLLLLLIVRADLLAQWRASLPESVPNHFLINIQPEETGPLAEFLKANGIEAPVLYPWVRARLTDINAAPLASIPFRSDRARGFAEREQNLSWSATLPADNRIVGGRWWEADAAGPGEPEVSVASEYSEDLGISPGDKLGFDVAGERIVARVASVRKVRWDGFRPNFFLLFRPGVLDASTGTYMTSVRIDAPHRPMLAELIRRFPGVTVFDVDSILNQVRGVMDRAALAVEYVSLFTVLAGLVVLLATVQATREERRYECATLRTLGARRSLVLGGIATEFVALGLLSGLLAAAAATIADYVLATRVFALPFVVNPWLWLLGPLAGGIIVGLAGVAAARSVMDTPPSLVLRSAA